ncbi:MAG: radical SAM protein [Eggerthellaceae bacterium]|nr:radical SAM protein [Eggerthellaceae bacterium]
MVEDITRDNYESLPGAAFRRYAKKYVDIEADFYSAVARFGLEREPEEAAFTRGDLERRAAHLAELGAVVANDCKSIHVGWISPSCVTCRKGVGTETFLASTQCPRNCYFCFNPNQEDYEYYLDHVHDIALELQQRYDAGVRHTDIAITGGEPLLHREQVLAMLERAAKLNPDAYTRLYTSGSGLDEEYARALAGTGLKELRFSVKLDEPEGALRKALERMRMCIGMFENVMVEMPVMPDQVDDMKALLGQLDEIGCSGINLLELCFPFCNAEEFAKRGYRLKAHPYRVLYDYWYAGGLPIAGSEQACLDLLEWAIGAGLGMGVHYCSLENKLTGQVYQQNRFIDAPHPRHEMSPRDHFLKSAKVFGADRDVAGRILREAGVRELMRDKRASSLEFPLSAVPLLADKAPDMPVAVSFAIAEQRAEGPVLRELMLQATTPGTFDYEADL